MRRYGPMPADSPTIGQKCPACDQPFREGDYTTLVAIGPGFHPEERERCREGRPYNAVCLEAHYACITGIEDVE